MRTPLPRLSPSRIMVTLAALLLAETLTVAQPQFPTSRQVLELFAKPTREYAPGPLWVWNDLLTEEQIRGTMRDLAKQKVMQVFVHPRPGLMTPYLSDDWFRLWKVALDEARSLDMNVWIYDENSYPSGFAGGFVPEALPESRGRGLVIEEKKSTVAWNQNLVGVYRVTEDGFDDVSSQARAVKSLDGGPYLVARVARAGDSPWHGGKCYVDLLRPGVTEKFLEITLGAYKREVGGEFSKRIPGIFTDEPHLRPAGGLPWTDGLPAVFEKRWGYSLLEHLPSLVRPVGDWKRVRHNYYQALLEEFIERWGKPYYELCEREGLEFTGHYWEHEWPRCILVPDNMALYAWHQRPAIDCLMNRYDEGTHAQFGNVRAVRELSSVANQLDRPRTLCEAYGAAGWELRFEDMKRIVDWLYVLGVNTLNEHFSAITIRGARKRDHPQSFSYHAPWWDEYHARASYATRLSVVLSQGKQVQPFLLLQPTTTAWLYQADPKHAARLAKLGDSFQRLVMRLEQAQVEYDIGSEDIIARHGSYRVRRLKVGKRAYRAVIIPPLTENLNARTVELLDELLIGSGTVVVCGDAPTLVEGSPAENGKAALPSGWERVSVEELPEYLEGLTTDGFSIERGDGDKGILFHHRRRLADGEILFLVNTSDAARSAGAVRSPARGAERWNLETGKAEPLHFKAVAGGVEVPFDLPPCGSLLLFLPWERREPAPQRHVTTTVLSPATPPAVRRIGPNVLTLDHVDVKAGDVTLKSVYVCKAAEFAFKRHGMPGNPWESAVQFRDELLRREFPQESGFTVSYRFSIAEKVPSSLFVVVERPDLYTVKLNGVQLSASPGSWWLDRSFGKIVARDAARVGENVLELTAAPFTVYHEIEAAYVLGDFGVRAADAGFVIVPPRELRVGSWKEQLLPLYGHGVSYTETFEIDAPAGTYRVRLPRWNGSVAKVSVNGRDAGIVESPPYERDVTAHVRGGRNTIEVIVIGTLKNTLGPHHAGPEVGAAWPGCSGAPPRAGCRQALRTPRFPTVSWSRSCSCRSGRRASRIRPGRFRSVSGTASPTGDALVR